VGRLVCTPCFPSPFPLLQTKSGGISETKKGVTKVEYEIDFANPLKVLWTFRPREGDRERSFVTRTSGRRSAASARGVEKYRGTDNESLDARGAAKER
jgi:hypothetical protein